MHTICSQGPPEAAWAIISYRFLTDRLQPGPASKLSLGRPPRPDPQISPNRHGSKHTLKSDSRRPSELILRLWLRGTPFWDPLGGSPGPSRQTPGPQNMHGFCSQGQPEAVRRRFLLVFYGHRYRKLPNGRRVAKSTCTLTAKYAWILQPGPARSTQETISA